jgi:hypothetical protein
MNYLSRLGYEGRLEKTPEGLKDVFDWYLSLHIPYETISNLETGVLIKSAAQMADTVIAGGGGHCVEHSVLLTEILQEAGFDAQLVNADYHDHRTGATVLFSKPLVVVRMDGGMWVCDPYYRSTMLAIPASGASREAEFAVTRHDRDKFTIAKLANDVPVDEDRADLNWSLQMREEQFRSRYRRFSPFGVTAPFYQLLRPTRKAVFYSPRDDAIVATDGGRYRVMDAAEIEHLNWVPEKIRVAVMSRLNACRRERGEALAFIDTGSFPPFYERLQRVI